MTLHELFNSVEFEELFLYLLKFDPRMKECEWGFRSAFTELQSLQPSKYNGCEIIIDYIDDDNPPDKSYGIGVYNCYDLDWATALGRLIKLTDRLSEITIEEIAALCLREMTFYGFSKQQTDRTHDWLVNKDNYSHKWEKIRDDAQKKWLFPIIDYNQARDFG